VTPLSRSRSAVLCVAAGLTALVINSIMAYLLGLRPAVFDGPMFFILLIVWGFCWIAFAVVDRADRADTTGRTRNYGDAIYYARRRRTQDSGSWNRPH
jgi:hypothetical protein